MAAEMVAMRSDGPVRTWLGLGFWLGLGLGFAARGDLVGDVGTHEYRHVNVGRVGALVRARW